MDSLATFSLKLAPGRGPGNQVIVNGEDVTERVASLSVQTSGDPRAIPVLNLQLAGTGTVEGEGIVQVSDGSTPIDAIRAFLEGIDPGVLDDLVNAELQVEAGTFGELALIVLTRMAGG